MSRRHSAQFFTWPVVHTWSGLSLPRHWLVIRRWVGQALGRLVINVHTVNHTSSAVAPSGLAWATGPVTGNTTTPVGPSGLMGWVNWAFQLWAGPGVSQLGGAGGGGGSAGWGSSLIYYQ